MSDSTLSTTKDKGAGEYDASGLTLPWTSVPGSTPAERVAMLAQDKRSIVLFWKTSLDPQDLGTPILMGSISPRTDSWQDTSFTLNSVMGLLDSRILVRENTYGGAANSTTSDEFTLHGSWRGIAAQVGYMCTDMKPGGRLPIDWNNRGESGKPFHGFQGLRRGQPVVPPDTRIHREHRERHRHAVPPVSRGQHRAILFPGRVRRRRASGPVHRAPALLPPIRRRPERT